MLSASMCIASRHDPSAWRHPRFCLAAVLVLLGGCATAPPPTPAQEVRDNVGVVAIVPARYAPTVNVAIHERYKEGAAFTRAAKMAASGLAGTAVLAAAFAPAFPVAIAVLTGGLATAGATATEAVNTSQGIVPAATVAEVESGAGRVVSGLDVQGALAGQLVAMVTKEALIRLAAGGAAGPDTPAASPDYAQLRTAGIDTVLEVAITEIGLSGCIANDLDCKPPPLLHLFMHAQVRLLRVTDGATLFEWPFHYKSGQRQPTSWVANDGRLLKEECEFACRELAQQIYDEVFLVTPIELPVTWGDCWLDQISPTCSWGSCYQVDTLQPTLQWSAFPREVERRRLDPAVLQKIGKVTYDLRIWDEVSELQEQKVFFTERWRNHLVYERTGLTAPQHTLEVSLTPDRRYYWSVRARFVAGGRSMATRWARCGGPGKCNSNEVDFQTNFYFFVVPK